MKLRARIEQDPWSWTSNDLKKGIHIDVYIPLQEVHQNVKKYERFDSVTANSRPEGIVRFLLFISKRFVYPDRREGFRIVYVPENFKYFLRLAGTGWKEKVGFELEGKDLKKYLKKYLIGGVK